MRYRVDGLHKGWIYPQTAHSEFSVSHLPPDRYTLELQAAGRDGQFGESRVLTIVMPPPPWRHPLAYVLYALLATLLRFIPYLGPFIAALFPLVLAFAVGHAIWRRQGKKLAAWSAAMLVPLGVAGVIFWERVAGLAERLALLQQYDFGHFRFPKLSKRQGI